MEEEGGAVLHCHRSNETRTNATQYPKLISCTFRNSICLWTHFHILSHLVFLVVGSPVIYISPLIFLGMDHACYLFLSVCPQCHVRLLTQISGQSQLNCIVGGNTVSLCLLFRLKIGHRNLKTHSEPPTYRHPANGLFHCCRLLKWKSGG